MEATVLIDGRPVRFKSTGGTMMRYRNQFDAEFLTDLRQLGEAKKDVNKFSYRTVEQIIWALAKTADATVPDPQTWFDSFDTIDVIDVWKQLRELISASLNSAKIKNAAADDPAT